MKGGQFANASSNVQSVVVTQNTNIGKNDDSVWQLILIDSGSQSYQSLRKTVKYSKGLTKRQWEHERDQWINNNGHMPGDHPDPTNIWNTDRDGQVKMYQIEKDKKDAINDQDNY